VFWENTDGIPVVTFANLLIVLKTKTYKVWYQNLSILSLVT
jgi:hypothetical protein